MDQRTRERLPVLPVLIAAVDQRPHVATDRLHAAQAVAAGEMFTVGGQTLRRSRTTHATVGKTWAEDPDTGKRRDLTLEEHQAFWTWAAVNVLRHTGIRIEELGGTLPPQPDPLPAARHRRTHPAAADRAVQDRHRTAPGRSAPNWPTCSAPSSAGSATSTAPSRWSSPTTTTNGSGTRRCRCCSNAASAARTGPSPDPPSVN